MSYGINPFKIAASMIGTKSTSAIDFSSDQITLDNAVTYTRVSSNGCNASEPGNGGAGSLILVIVIVIVIVIIAVVAVVLYFSLSKKTNKELKKSTK